MGDMHGWARPTRHAIRFPDRPVQPTFCQRDQIISVLSPSRYSATNTMVCPRASIYPIWITLHLRSEVMMEKLQSLEPATHPILAIHYPRSLLFRATLRISWSWSNAHLNILIILYKCISHDVHGGNSIKRRRDLTKSSSIIYNRIIVHNPI